MDDHNLILEKVRQSIVELEDRRQRHFQSAQNWIGVSIVLGLIAATFTIKLAGINYLLFVIVGIVLSVIGTVLTKKLEGFQEDYKEQVFSMLLKVYNPSLDYTLDDHIDHTVFGASNLFESDYRYFGGKDLIKGKIGDTRFQLSKLEAYQKIEGDEESKTFVFNGIFLEADFHKYFHSDTFVVPKISDMLTGYFGMKHVGASMIEMEDRNFEEVFNVFTTDEQDARYILSLTLMNRIRNLQNRFAGELSISFRRNSIYVAINNLNFMTFDHDLDVPLDPQLSVKEILGEIHSFLSIIDDLNLNTRIWSKLPDYENLELLDRNELDDIPEPLDKEEEDDEHIA